MFKQVSLLEVKGNEDRMHRFECPPETPLGEVHDALESMKLYVIEQIKAHSEKKEKSEECGVECEEKIEEIKKEE